ncbi:acetyltransferase [Pseudomonas weihenstephanensis]|uniref:Acetyltransferase n=1 Tax=Pseudomonas weihenstephanensis TaxID=1608994 RepID=A0A0J6J2B3_9PSED|nr:acetyltransferase [Pseudomonas weihenstephanensis]KMN15703.1 acetyltransferase [Pseudomonas weihenstephanensis]KMN18567.1 acetyltransferase [Pseudomonas weihenstephanensis]MBM1190167.1 acetyltransferase [Pseudomonas weihenstephanensis]GLX88105.1 acetyltransferase [Pseudomonas fragi]
MGRVWVVETPQHNDLKELCQVWDDSVRATHDFLPNRYIQELRELVEHSYLKAVTLICCKDPLTRRIAGFAGIHADKVEMLFIDPEYRGLGVGNSLLRHAINHLHAVQLDVNEQNLQAIGFYFKQGFEVIGRSEKDGMGEPYPLLHLRYKRTTPAQGKCSRA